MRVIVNGRPADRLDPKLARRITPRREPQVAEGAVLSEAAIVATASRRLKLIYGVAGGLAVLVNVAVLIGAAVSEPGLLLIAGPFAIILGAGLAWLMVFVYRRNMAKTRARVGPQLARLPSPGTTIRADDVGLAIDGHAEPWAAFEIEAIEIRDIRTEDSTYALIECLTVNRGGHVIGLDGAAISQGRAVVDKAWARLREAAAATASR